MRSSQVNIDFGCSIMVLTNRYGGISRIEVRSWAERSRGEVGTSWIDSRRRDWSCRLLWSWEVVQAEKQQGQSKLKLKKLQKTILVYLKRYVKFESILSINIIWTTTFQRAKSILNRLKSKNEARSIFWQRKKTGIENRAARAGQDSKG